MNPPPHARWTGPQPVVLALGSNRGPRLEILLGACRALARHGIRPARSSRVFETAPLAGSSGGKYLNACIAVQTRLAPAALLARCLGIERSFGRVRRERWAPRPLDIDLIVYGNLQINRPGLTLPHPGLNNRDFVLVGLLDLSVGFPVPGCRNDTARIREWLKTAETCIASVHRERLF